MKRTLAALLIVAATPVWAGSGTIAVTEGSGKNVLTTTDGSSNNAPAAVIVDGTAAANKAAVTASSALKVDGSAVTQPVSGTVTATGTVAATQSGIWTVQPGNTANTTAWKVDGSAVTQPISAASLPLPSTAATSTKQSDGSQKTQVVDGSGNVIGATSNALDVNVKSGGTVAQGSTTSGQGGSLVMGATTTASPSYTTAQTNALSLTTDGALRVQNQGNAAGGSTAYFVQPTASDNHANIKNGAGTVYSITATNNSATLNYLRLYNAASGFNGCNSATNLVTQVAIPASTSGAGITHGWPVGINFSTGISICVTSGYATNDTTNATASAMSVTVAYN